jgi:hypothetical protein
MNRSASEPAPGPFAAPSQKALAAGLKFHFGSGRHYSSSTVKQTQCIIYRSETQPALIGQRARSLSRRLSA